MIRKFSTVFFFTLCSFCSAHAQNDTELVRAHVAAHASDTFRPPSGYLKFPYLVPAGPYTQAWDWDSMFMGIALQTYHATPYFVGTFKNFLSNVNLTNGELPGCVTPSGPTPTLYHAKPMIIQAAWLASKQTGNPNEFLTYAPAMRALLGYWNTSTRVDSTTGLHVWHDQLETGCDNLVFSECPSVYSPECWSEAQAFTLASPDLEVWMAREYLAYAKFTAVWHMDGWQAERDASLKEVERIRDVIHKYLWHWTDATHTAGYYVAFNVSTQAQIVRRTFQVAWPVWAGLASNATVAAAALATLQEPDLWSSTFGLRSVSNLDPRYNNDNVIVPYSNWRGPLWVNVNAIMAYTLRAHGLPAAAANLADAIVHTLANDLRNGGVWHESYSGENGTALAAPGFLSWDTLVAELQANVAVGVDPFQL